MLGPHPRILPYRMVAVDGVCGAGLGVASERRQWRRPISPQSENRAVSVSPKYLIHVALLPVIIVTNQICDRTGIVVPRRAGVNDALL